MSQENVEIVRRAWEAYISRGFEATLDFWAEDCVWEDFPEQPDAGVHVGWEGVAEAVEQFTQAWIDLSFEPVEVIDAGGDLVVAVIAYRGRGRGSGAPLDARVTWLYEVRNGKVDRARTFTSKQQALEAAGLRE